MYKEHEIVTRVLRGRAPWLSRDFVALLAWAIVHELRETCPLIAPVPPSVAAILDAKNE